MLGEWKARTVPVMVDRIEPPEPESRPRELAPGFAAFMFRLGLEPRPAVVLFDWRLRLLRRGDLKRRAEYVAEFKLIRDTYLSVFPRGKL